MTGFDANEHLTPFRDARGYGAILFDRTQLRQPEPAWFDPEHWGLAAQRVSEGGRGGAWFIDFGQGDALLRHYLRGGLVARFSRDRHLWRGIQRARSFAEFRLLRTLRAKKLPVPLPFGPGLIPPPPQPFAPTIESETAAVAARRTNLDI